MDPVLTDQHLEQTPDEQTVIGIAGGRIRAVHIRLENAVDLALDEKQRGLGRSVANQHWTFSHHHSSYPKKLLKVVHSPLKLSSISTYLLLAASL